jgi:hypothetical protein
MTKIMWNNEFSPYWEDIGKLIKEIKFGFIGFSVNAISRVELQAYIMDEEGKEVLVRYETQEEKGKKVQEWVDKINANKDIRVGLVEHKQYGYNVCYPVSFSFFVKENNG